MVIVSHSCVVTIGQALSKARNLPGCLHPRLTKTSEKITLPPGNLAQYIGLPNYSRAMSNGKAQCH